MRVVVTARWLVTIGILGVRAQSRFPACPLTFRYQDAPYVPPDNDSQGSRRRAEWFRGLKPLRPIAAARERPASPEAGRACVDGFTNSRYSCDSVLLGQRNRGGKHTVRIETTLQRSQPYTVAAVSMLSLLAIMTYICYAHQSLLLWLLFRIDQEI
jgi:hypothetical protein